MAIGRREVLLGVALAVIAAGLTGAASAAAAPPLTGEDAQTQVEADTVSLRVELRASGAATWQVTYRVELADANETAAFEDLRDDIRSDPAPYLDRFGTRMRRAMWAAENATGRDMSIGNLSVSARIESLPQGRYGVVVYRLDWEHFAVVDGDRIRAGDAIDQFFLDERTSLTIAWPEAYGLVSHEPSATTVENGSVTWQGRRDFGPGEPRVEIVRGGTAETPGAGGLPLLPIGLVVLVVVATGGWVYLRRGGRPAEGGEPAATVGEEGPPPELLSNEERVLHLLEQHGGRIKQQQVAEELDWTDAKTSQVVSDLREADEVESFRLGRENVLTLPDVSLEEEGDEPST